eukprot:9166298-Karenia_brevis.AAC.1
MEPTLHLSLKEYAFALRPGKAHKAMTMVNGACLPLHSERLCMCAAPRRGAHGKDNGSDIIL